MRVVFWTWTYNTFYVKQAFPFSLECMGIECNVIILPTIFVCSSMNHWEMSCFAPQQQSQLSYSRWHVWAGKEQRLCLSRAKMPRTSWSSSLCTFCPKVSLQLALCDSNKCTMYIYWIVTLLTCTEYQISLTECRFISISQNDLILCTMLSHSSAEACWKPFLKTNATVHTWGL